MEAKQNLSAITEKRPPEFMQALQITKTRAGMQFSCASPVDGVNTSGYRDVWVCNSDGYVGHMCLLSLQPEPIVTLNTPVPGCNSKILCIFAVPAYSGPLKRKGSGRNRSMDSGHQDDFNQVSLELSNTESSDGSESDTESTDDEDDMPSYSRRNVGRHTRQSSESSKQTPLLDPYKSTMWLGTDNGYIHIFQSTDNIKTTKNKLKVPHPAGVLCIVHLDCKVFASLANGEIRVYRRDADGSWDTQHPDTLSVGTVTSPVTKMLAVAGKLWCGCQSGVMMLNPTTLVSEVSFQIPTDSPRPIQSMVCSGQGVWIAPQGSSKVVLFHATNRQFLTDISIAQAVTQKLMATDDIIRQHKTACLRITSLLACKDLLWVGTSAGVILTIPLPKITSSTTKSTLQAPTVTGLVHGHTGHVRFLTAVEMPSSRPFPEQSLQQHHLIRRRSIGGTPARATKMLVISGGDGYEDFRTGINNEAAGRDDSTNHLLLWQV
ncbi:rho guanine nucleotide exchange factor 17-like [Lingula anatina]|nr:rho guanine nucleotide exchange factor 17-like [Lingula anatina]|eukprot:XP_013379625.1 rho guanine nucleotide exchange factor 17-like [Lingula anatina]